MDSGLQGRCDVGMGLVESARTPVGNCLVRSLANWPGIKVTFVSGSAK